MASTKVIFDTTTTTARCGAITPFTHGVYSIVTCHHYEFIADLSRERFILIGFICCDNNRCTVVCVGVCLCWAHCCIVSCLVSYVFSVYCSFTTTFAVCVHTFSNKTLLHHYHPPSHTLSSPTRNALPPLLLPPQHGRQTIPKTAIKYARTTQFIM